MGGTPTSLLSLAARVELRVSARILDLSTLCLGLILLLILERRALCLSMEALEAEVLMPRGLAKAESHMSINSSNSR